MIINFSSYICGFRKKTEKLNISSNTNPYKPEANSLATELKVSRNSIADYLLYMEKAGMIGQLRDETKERFPIHPSE